MGLWREPELWPFLEKLAKHVEVPSRMLSIQGRSWCAKLVTAHPDSKIALTFGSLAVIGDA